MVDLREDEQLKGACARLGSKRLVKSSGQSKWSKYDQISRKSSSPVRFFVS